MAVVSVTYQGARVNTGEATTNWVAAGATPTLEPDFRYQGSNCISASVKTTEAGFYYRQAGLTHDFQTAPVVWLAKVIATNKDALDGNGLILEIGTGTRTAYHRYFIYNASTYPIAGGWAIIPIDPNIAGLRSASVGTPNLAAVDFFGVQADFNATSKAPNLGMDAIDYIVSGTGLSLTGGDGVDADGTFNSFLSFDEGNTANRYGIVSSRDGIIYVVGTLMIAGNGNTATGFTDSNKVLVFPGGLFNNGFAGVYFNLVNASTTINISSCTFNSRGAVGSFSDTRANYFVNNTNGTLTFSGNSFNTFRNFTLTSACTVTNCAFSNGLLITQAGSTLTGCTFSGQTTIAGESLVLSTNPQLISSCTFTSGGAGHAIQITTAGTYNFSANFFNSYGANNTTDAAVYNNVTPTTAASYSEANQDAATALNSGGTVGASQSFAGNNGVLSSCRFMLKKTGSPTGTAVCKIYAHSGTFGTSSVPTGAALATSGTLDVSALFTTYALAEFKFTGASNITLNSGTNYVLTVEYSGGSVGNTVDVGRDASAPGAAGNFATYNGVSWTAVSGSDACFYVYTGGQVILNITNNGGTPTVRNALGCSTTINNAVSLNVTVLNTIGSPIQNARVAIYKTSDNSEITNQLTNSSGQITASYAYLSNESIYIRVRKSSTGTTRYINNDSSGTITSTGFSATVTLLTDSTATP